MPAALAEEVAADAVQQELEEEWALERVDAGESTVGVFPISKERRAEFEAWLRAMPAGPSEVLDRKESAMPRRSIEIEGFRHVNPIPAASRVGPLLVSSIIAARDPGRRPHPRRRREPSSPTSSTTSAPCSPPPAPTGATSPR